MYKIIIVLNMLIWFVGRVFFLIIVLKYKDLLDLVIFFCNMLIFIIYMFVCREKEYSFIK